MSDLLRPGADRADSLFDDGALLAAMLRVEAGWLAVLDHVLAAVRRQVAALADLAARHRDAVLPGRTLTQYAVPITFGFKAATWLSAVLDAAHDLAEHAGAGAADLLAERAAMRELAGAEPPDGEVAHCLGATQLFVTAVLDRAEQFAKALS